MEKLRTDYLDLLLHQPFGDTFGAWRVLEELYKEGKLRAIGISNHYADRMVEFANFTTIKPMVNQMEVHPFNLDDENMKQIAQMDTATSAFFSHQDPAMVEWFADMLEERKKNHDCTKEKKNW